MTEQPTHDHHPAPGPGVIIGLVVLGGLVVLCTGAVALGFLGRARGWW